MAQFEAAAAFYGDSGAFDSWKHEIEAAVGIPRHSQQRRVFSSKYVSRREQRSNFQVAINESICR